MKLEELARQSSDAARASVVRLDPPPIGERPARARWQVPALVGAAALVLVAGLASIFVLNDDDDGGRDGESIVAGAQDIPKLGLPELSAWELTTAADLAELSEDVGNDMGRPPRFDYYGDATAEDPFAEGDLLVLTMPDTDSSDFSGSGYDEVEVRGTTGYIADGSQAPGDSTIVQWTETIGDTQVGFAVASHSLAIDDLVAVADGLRIEAGGPAGARVEPAEDVGLDLVATGADSPFASFQMAPVSGWLVAYARPGGADEGEFGQLTLVTQAGDLEREATAARWWSTDFRSVRVGDAPGYETSYVLPSDEETTRVGSVVWAPRPGVVATLVYAGTAPLDDLAALAASARELDDETWAQYQEIAKAHQADATAADFDEVFGTGQGELGELSYQWVLGLQNDGRDLCFDLQFDVGAGASSGSGSCQAWFDVLGQVRPDSARTVDNATMGEGLTAVLIVASPTVEQVRESSGTGTMQRVDAPVDEVSWFVYIGPADHQPSFEVIVDGEVVDTLEAAVEATEAAADRSATGSAEAAAVSTIDVTSHPSAQSLGIADDFTPVLSGGDGRVDWTMGEVAGDLCVVTDGEVVGAACMAPAQLTAFRPNQLDDGTSRSWVVVRDLPGCLSAMQVVSDDDTAQTTEVASTTLSTGEQVTVLVVDGPAEQRRLVVSDEAGTTFEVDVPDIEGATGEVAVSGTATSDDGTGRSLWPTDACAG